MSHLHAANEDKLLMTGRLNPDRGQSRIDLTPKDQLAAAALDLRLILELASQRFAAQKRPCESRGICC